MPTTLGFPGVYDQNCFILAADQAHIWGAYQAFGNPEEETKIGARIVEGVIKTLGTAAFFIALKKNW